MNCQKCNKTQAETIANAETNKGFKVVGICYKCLEALK